MKEQEKKFDEMDDIPEEDRDNRDFVDFLLALLKKTNATNELISGCLAEVALLSQIPSEHDVLVEKEAVQVLLGLLEQEVEKKDNRDELKLLSVGKALVNISAGNTEAKSIIIAQNATTAIIPLLSYTNPDLARTFAALLKNCTNTPEHRKKIAEQGAIGPLVGLLQTTQLPSGKSSDPVIVAAASAIWNLATTESNISRIVNPKSGVNGLKQLVAIVRQNKNEEVLAKCVGALMVLAKANNKTEFIELKLKRSIGCPPLAGETDWADEVEDTGVVGTLCGQLRKSKNVTLLRNICGLFAFLCSDDDIAKLMKQHQIVEGLEYCKRAREKRMEAFVGQIELRLGLD
eukprot:TRINITY_DN1166_c0_g1_i6.p1 TRINITY_DN1166_c0_g1~~TRINITY_DN1166_c0_g1_i6.p1  ORF type:complete len:346 (+),score=133.70 TRINITY_DN1166_c0_g1_i6:833-1870(+)